MVKFDPVNHKYTNEKGTVYTSATTLVSKFKQPFNALEVATAYAKKHGETAPYWMAQWALAGKKATDKGTKFHKLKEDRLRTAEALIIEDRAFQVQPEDMVDVVKYDYTALPDGVYLELLLWDDEHSIAGIADRIIIDGVWFDIEDYKTSKKIDQTSYYNHKTKTHKMMQFPLQSLMDCNFNHYTIQMSIYAYMLEKLTGKTCRNLTLLHHPPDPENDDLALDMATPYDVPYRKAEVEAILEYLQLH